MSAVATRPRTAAPAAQPPAAPIRVIEPWKHGIRARLHDVWRHRRLIPYYGKCYIMRRFKNTWLGWIWLPLRPGVDMLTKAFFFGGFLGVSSGDRPYIIFFTFGSCGWVLFESMSRWGARAIRMSNRFVKNAHAPWLPRMMGLILPGLVDFALYTAVAIGAIFYYLATRGKLYIVPSTAVGIACLGIVLLAAWGLALALIMAPLTQGVRDVRYLFNYVTAFWYYMTPITYPISSLPPKYQPIAELNPLTAPVEMVKYGFLQTAPPTVTEYAACLIGLVVFGTFGLWMFNRFERAAVERTWMRRSQLHTPHVAESVVIAVDGVSKAAPKPPAQPPRWLARFLPGVQWSALADRDDGEEDDEEEEDEDFKTRKGALEPVSFELSAGEGLGLIGDDRAAKTLLSLLLGLYPPSTGRITIRGRVAPLLRFSEINFSSGVGRSSLKVISNMLQWPPEFLRNRWDEIVDFAHLDELDEFGFPPESIEYAMVRTKRLFLSAVMHLDASTYVVLKNFAGTDVAIAERCNDLLEQRQREGCGILHTGKAPEDVARFCRDGILFAEGAPIFQGRLGAVATVIAERRAAERQKREQKLLIPFRALLLSTGGGVIIGRDGGKIELELDVFSALEFTLGLRFSDQEGRETQFEYPEPFQPDPGVYRLEIALPAGLLDDAVYTATLLATAKTPDDAEAPPPVELLTFEVSSQTGVATATPGFGVFADDGEQANPQDVEWDVHRVEI